MPFSKPAEIVRQAQEPYSEVKDLLGMDKSDSWHVYIIECKDKKLYVGIAKDLDKRIELHNKGLACRFTKYRKPVRLIYKEA